jgi:hypothetical protein
MKKIMLCTMLLFLTASLFSQQTNPQSLSRQDYLEKSKKQKTAAWILLGGGLAPDAKGFVRAFLFPVAL